MTMFDVDSIYAPADVSPGTGSREDPVSTEPGSPLGLVPHQLRGMLGQWRTMLIEGAAYDKCTGCSKTVSLATCPLSLRHLSCVLDCSGA